MARSPAHLSQPGQAALDLALRASIEVSARELRKSADIAVPLLAGRETFLPWTPNLGADDMIEATSHAKRLGLTPVPHVAARRLASEEQARNLLEGLSGAGAEAVLLIGGDLPDPAGPYKSSLDLLCSGLLQAGGIRRIGVAGYPEGHPALAEGVILEHLERKLAYARDAGLEAFILSQFCFEGPVIAQWVRGLRERGVTVPVRVGVAGPTNLAKLLELGLRCGVGNSIRTLRGMMGSVLRLVATHDPREVIEAVAAARLEGAAPGPVSLHLFAFGGAAMTARWMKQLSQDSSEQESPTTGIGAGR